MRIFSRTKSRIRQEPSVLPNEAAPANRSCTAYKLNAPSQHRKIPSSWVIFKLNKLLNHCVIRKETAARKQPAVLPASRLVWRWAGEDRAERQPRPIYMSLSREQSSQWCLAWWPFLWCQFYWMQFSNMQCARTLECMNIQSCYFRHLHIYFQLANVLQHPSYSSIWKE